MQIGTGSSPLSLAVLKTLGVQAPGAVGSAAPATAAGKSAAQSATQSAAGSAVKVAPGGGDPSRDLGAERLGVEKTVPRGSFVDLKV